ncbi:MAG TPA: dihydropteroate synthase [Calditrichaeota bacterium]|nr:dihydropteroate synthase [Calditrichota bacterium]
MRSKAIYISGQARLLEVRNRYHVTLSTFYIGRYIFELSSLTGSQKKNLAKLSSGSKVVHQWPTLKNSTQLIAFCDEVDDSFFQQVDDIGLQSFLQRVYYFYRQENKPVWDRLNFEQAPLIMGVLNVTPDSFSDGGQYTSVEHALRQAMQMVEQGAHIIDVGGESTRPGAAPVCTDEELNRVVPVIQAIRKESDVLISIDTKKSVVAEAALQNGAYIISDVSGLRSDPKMADIARQYECAVVVMHMKGEPRTMQQNPWYDDVMGEIYSFFEERITFLRKKGLNKIIIDPGIGFGKRVEDNLIILRDLKDFLFLGAPILVGASRKSFIGKVLNKEVDKRLYGTLASHSHALENGAKIIRVHDVYETADIVGIFKHIHGFN